jgi:hypothetical protein
LTRLDLPERLRSILKNARPIYARGRAAREIRILAAHEIVRRTSASATARAASASHEHHF